MINHARTLLMNVAGWFPKEIGEEFMPDNYRPVSPTPALALVRSILYGTTPDRLFLNYRTLQLMTLLHSTELEEHVLALDKRITYWPSTRQQFFNATFGTTYVQHAGPTVQVSFLGDAVADDRVGRSQDSWAVTIPEEGVANVQRVKAPRTAYAEAFTTSGGLSSPIPLVGTDLTLRISAGTAGVEGMIGAALFINNIGRPQLDLGELDAMLQTTVDRTMLDQIFYGDGASVIEGPTEPFRTFRNLWHSHPLLAYRLGGLLLGCIYRTEAIRQNG